MVVPYDGVSFADMNTIALVDYSESDEEKAPEKDPPRTSVPHREPGRKRGSANIVEATAKKQRLIGIHRAPKLFVPPQLKGRANIATQDLSNMFSNKKPGESSGEGY